jgi:hypothetical protein
VTTHEQLLYRLESGGLLLMQDACFPSLVTFVVGETVKGSWWAHPLSHQIFRCAGDLAAHRDSLVIKLVHGKVTFVHRRLWPEVLAVATARESWQTTGLSQDACALWQEVERRGTLVASGAAAKEIERRLLAHGEQFHAETGSHKTCLETWQAWSQRCGGTTDLPPKAGRSRLEAAVEALGGRASSLPWHRPGPISTATRRRSPIGR